MESAAITSRDDEVEVTEPTQVSATLALLQVSRRGDFFLLEARPPTKPEVSCEKVWLVLKMLKVPGSHRGYLLSEGDVLRLGRAVLRVSELKTSKQESYSKGPVPSTQLLSGHLHLKSEKYTKDSTTHSLADIEFEMLGEFHSSNQCRVCYSDCYTMDDPLVSICLCAGSLKFLHISCLKSWIRSKVEVREKGIVKTFEWKRLECELCKTQYPLKVLCGGMSYDLLHIPKPHPNYMLLEEAMSLGNNSYTCFYIPLEASQLRCGRSHDCPVRVKDISVSRSHATLHVSREGVSIEDNGSKFGTLALVNRAIVMQLRTEVPVQVGKTVFVFKVKRAWSLWDCFGSCRRQTSPSLSLDSIRPETPKSTINSSLG